MRVFCFGVFLYLIFGYSLVKELEAQVGPQIFAYPYYSIQGIWNGVSNFKYSDLSSAQICHYYGINKNETGKNTCHKLLQGSELFNSPYFIVAPTQKTVLYIHGYDVHAYSRSIETIVDAYLSSGREFNVLVLDWTLLSQGNYIFEVTRNAEHLSHLVTDMLLNFFMHKDFEIENFHIVGHSIGAHMGGNIGRLFSKKTHNGLKLKRISGLDPAYPLYYPPIYQHISKDDAEFVDIIHTDAWVYGAPKSTGTVDFWPNKGKGPQPGCKPRDQRPLSNSDVCSHSRSWMLWAESVRNEFSFASIKCLSWVKFKLKFCSSGKQNYMGIDCDLLSATGDYFLQTNDRSLFSRGIRGVDYEFSLN